MNIIQLIPAYKVVRTYYDEIKYPIILQNDRKIKT